MWSPAVSAYSSTPQPLFRRPILGLRLYFIFASSFRAWNKETYLVSVTFDTEYHHHPASISPSTPPPPCSPHIRPPRPARIGPFHRLRPRLGSRPHPPALHPRLRSHLPILHSGDRPTMSKRAISTIPTNSSQPQAGSGSTSRHVWPIFSSLPLGRSSSSCSNIGSTIFGVYLLIQQPKTIHLSSSTDTSIFTSDSMPGSQPCSPSS